MHLESHGQIHGDWTDFLQDAADYHTRLPCELHTQRAGKDMNSYDKDKQRLRAQAAGQTRWGKIGSADQLRYMTRMPGRYRNRSKCHCGCRGKASHSGAANGVTLVWGCELSTMRWVKTGEFRTQEVRDRLRSRQAALKNNRAR